MATFHPDLKMGRFIPRVSMGRRLTTLANRVHIKQQEVPEDLLIDDIDVPGPPGAPSVPVRLYRSRTATARTPVLLWLHGGGMVIGNHLSDERTNIASARTLGITVASVGYRLAPEHPAPAAVEDAYAVLEWLHAHADERLINPELIAVGGESAGGGLAAGLAQMALDRGGIQPVFQLLIYPMLDDRTVLRTDLDAKNARLWSPGSNRYGWTSYLGRPPGQVEPPPYAAPARRQDLSGLPPAWIGVGTLDLFHDEDLDYARRLQAVGVACDTVVIPGAFHGFYTVFFKTSVSKAFRQAQIDALRQAFLAAG